jgi:hypothetical protein
LDDRDPTPATRTDPRMLGVWGVPCRGVDNISANGETARCGRSVAHALVPDDLWVCRRCIEDARARFFGLDDAPRPLLLPPGSYGKTVTCREYSEWFFADRRKRRMGGGLRTARSEQARHGDLRASPDGRKSLES